MPSDTPDLAAKLDAPVLHVDAEMHDALTKALIASGETIAVSISPSRLAALEAVARDAAKLREAQQQRTTTVSLRLISTAAEELDASLAVLAKEIDGQ